MEPYFGSGAVFFEKPRFGTETINDLNAAVANYFRVLQQRPEELMWLMLTTPWARDVLLLARAVAPEGEDPARRTAAGCPTPRARTRRRCGARCSRGCPGRRSGFRACR
ncbi:MAG: DNA adenine methylase [Rubrobacter sp.]|nr:DNA adenine methylase [Rubrobacter sp.]